MKHTLLLVLLLSPFAFGLSTAYVTFEHPPGWECELTSGVWICQSNQEQDKKESVLLSIASQATKWDSLENYETYLKKPRTIQDDKGTSITSEVTYTRRRVINGHTWIDSLQKNSELPGFWARYLATIQQTKSSKLAILITFIISQERYSKLAPPFERLVTSLKPRLDFDATVASKQGDQILPGSTVMGQVQKNILSRLRPNPSMEMDEEAVVTEETDNTNLILALVIGVVAFLVLRQRSKKKK